MSDKANRNNANNIKSKFIENNKNENRNSNSNNGFYRTLQGIFQCIIQYMSIRASV